MPVPNTLKPMKALLASLVLGAVLIPLTRLPQLSSRHLVPDNDECAIGVMAKHILEGKALPLFIYGQNYGLAIVEAGTAAMFFKAFGVSAVPLKVAMLVLWAVAWFFLVLAVRRMAGTAAACVAAFVMATCPAWGPWSMKAWGGYITSFLFSNLGLWLLAGIGPGKRRPVARCMGVGCCLGMVYLAQPIWLLGLAPFILLAYLRSRKPSDVLVMGVCAAFIALLIRWLGSNVHAPYSAPLFEHQDPIRALTLLPTRIWVVLTSTHIHHRILSAGPFTMYCATLWVVVLVLGILHELRAWGNGKRFTTGQACASAVILLLTFTLAVNVLSFGYRYLLPFVGFAVILLSVLFSRFYDKEGIIRKVTIGAVLVLVVLGTLSLVEQGGQSFSGNCVDAPVSEVDALNALVEYLNVNRIHDVYCVDMMLQWTVIFASQERVLARWPLAVDKYPAYTYEVDRALVKGERVAIVGRVRQAYLLGKDLQTFRDELRRLGRPDLNPRVIGDVYFVLLDPGEALVRGLGFQLTL